MGQLKQGHQPVNPVFRKISSRNAAFQKFEVLKTNRNKRHRYGQFFLEGVRNINQALKHDWVIEAWLYNPEGSLSDWAARILSEHPAPVHYQLTESMMQLISGKTDRSELCAVARMRPWTGENLVLANPPLLVLFDRPSNKGNLGNLIRTCDGFAADGILLTGHGVDPYDPDTIAASMGSFFSIPLIPFTDHGSLLSYLDDLRLKWPGLLIIGSSEQSDHLVFQQDMLGPLVLILGNETEGMSLFCRQLCDVTVKIPMSRQSTASSFNVASAAAILLYEVVRQRQSRQAN